MTRHRIELRDIAAVVLLLLLTVAFTWRIALAGRVLAGGDIFTYFYPYWAEATRAIRAGRLPLWNSSLFMGVPFAANSQVGLFYPLNWPLWLLLPAHRSVHVTIVVHLCLAALNAYLWGRKALRLGRVGSWTVGATYALGGYLGAQVEHVNQLQGLAWLPLMLTLADRVVRPGMSGSPRDELGDAGPSRSQVRGRLKASCALATVVALVLLAGHSQTAFISLFGTAVYALVPTLWRAVRRGEWHAPIRRGALLLLGPVLAAALAAVQLLPTWQLAQLSVRAQGLPFNERVSFSLSPLYAGRALLPAFSGAIPPEHLEHVAYAGVTGVALAVLALVSDLRRHREARRHGQGLRSGVYTLAIVGLFFALGLYNPLYVLLARYVPGFAHFRVPARWLALYGVGIAALAGRAVQELWERRTAIGLQVLPVALSLAVLVLWAAMGAGWDGNASLHLLDVVAWITISLSVVALLVAAWRRPRAVTIGLLVLLTGELFLAKRMLPQARATAAQAFTSVRPAVAHLLASEGGDAGPRERFLSMSDTTFDPGDLSSIRLIYGPQLPDDALYDYIVASKQKEILSPNLPLAFGVPSVDGYDGGVLPLQRYVALQRAFLPEDEVSIDGRLRENLTAISEGRWLSLLNVRYVITDKLHDAWIDDVFYDLQFGAQLSQGESAAVGEVPRFEATALGVVSHVEGVRTVPDGAPVGLVRLRFADGSEAAFALRAGEDVPVPPVQQGENEPMATRVRWPEPRIPVTVSVEAKAGAGQWVVRGLSLIDERTSSFQSLVVSDEGRFRVVHSGDVKIYENLDVLLRAFIVPQARVVDDEEEAIVVMRDPMVDLSSEVILESRTASCGQRFTGPADPGRNLGEMSAPSASAVITSYGPGRVVVRTALDRAGYLLLTDAHYPGWQATVDGVPTSICRADLLFRAVPLEPGQHRVVFTFQPPVQRVGLGISGMALLVLIALWNERCIVETVVRCYNRMQA